MKTITTYLRKTDTGVAEVDSTNRPLRNVAAVIRNEQAQINLRIFDGAVATTPMTGEQLAGYVSWYLRIGPQADMRGPVCIEAGNESITVSEAGVVSITIATTDTVQAASEIGNATRAIWTADLAAFPVDSENPTMVLQWRIAYINRVASENEPPPESQTSDFYQKPVIDAKFAAVGASIPAATTVARGTIQIASADEAAAGLDTSKAIVPATLKTELDKKENTANKATDFSVIDDDKFPTIKAVKTYVGDVVGDIEAVLDELIGGDA